MNIRLRSASLDKSLCRPHFLGLLVPRLALLLYAWLLFGAPATAAEWSQWRFDAARSDASVGKLLGRPQLLTAPAVHCSIFAPTTAARATALGRPEAFAHRPLHFAEPGDRPAGTRVFHVALQGRTVLKNFDPPREAPRNAAA